MDFESIYARYYPVVYRFLLGLSRDRALSEDIAQETFFRAIRASNTFHGECDVGTWLIQIAKNLFYSHERKFKRVRALLPGDIKGNAESAESHVEREERARFMHEALHELREPYKEVFTLRVFAELSFARIAQLFQKSESWARVTYYRAKVMLREREEEL